jgi:hypothetical protein
MKLSRLFVQQLVGSEQEMGRHLSADLETTTASSHADGLKQEQMEIPAPEKPD